MTNRKKNGLERALRPLEILLTLALIGVFFEVILEVSFRYLLHRPLAWGSEFSQTVLVWITFVGSALALFRGEHMSVNLVMNCVRSPRKRLVLQIIGGLSVLAFLVIAFHGGIQVTQRTWTMKTTALQMPAGILYLAFPVGCLIMVPAVLRDLYLKIRKE